MTSIFTRTSIKIESQFEYYQGELGGGGGGGGGGGRSKDRESERLDI